MPALRVDAIDPTGAGDVFDAGVARGHAGGLAAAPAAQLRGAVLEPGGAAVRRLARRPGLGRHRGLVAPRSGPPDGDAAARPLQRRFAFLDDLVAAVPVGAVRRAAATIAKLSDV